jgi:hypothetical protein
MTYIPRDRQGYWGKAVFISTGDYTQDNIGSGIVQLSRITDVGFSAQYPLAQEMYLNAANESWMNAPGSITTSLRWAHTNSQNEQYIGLAAPTANGTWALTIDSPKNLYITVENAPGIDAIGATGYSQTKTVIGMAQGLLFSYSLSAAVGSLVESEAHLNYLTSFIYSGQSGDAIPSVNYSDGSQVTGIFSLPPASAQYLTNEPSGYLSTGNSNYVSAISANDLIMTFPVGAPFGVSLTGYQSCYLQSFNCTLSIDRHDLKPMGYLYSPNRPAIYPLRVDLSMEAIVSSYQADQLGRISCLGTGNAINIIVKQPCSNATLFGLYFTELQLESQDFVTTIGHNDVVSLKYRAILSNPNQAFISPVVNYLIRTDTSGAWGLNW